MADRLERDSFGEGLAYKKADHKASFAVRRNLGAVIAPAERNYLAQTDLECIGPDYN